jgi:hypothetical protein
LVITKVKEDKMSVTRITCTEYCASFLTRKKGYGLGPGENFVSFRGNEAQTENEQGYYWYPFRHFFSPTIGEYFVETIEL